MKTFLCDQCGQPVFFENVHCLACGSSLAFVPERMDLCAVTPVAQPALPVGAGVQAPPPLLPELVQRIGAQPGEHRWRMCSNYHDWQACNFAVPEEDPNPLCVSCRQTRVRPDLGVPQNQQRWYRIEVAKRRLFYTLAQLRLVRTQGAEDPALQGPVYEFLADQPGRPAVMTGHDDGLITINIAEADDDERVRRRVALHEPYRTLLGHLRHESGHYYWDRLIRDQGRTDAFRAVFGDESQDYGQALQAHYARDPGSIAWQNDFVSIYATSHAWEDWAETWAHYLHMIDLLDTAAAYQTTVAVPGGPVTVGDSVVSPFSDAALADPPEPSSPPPATAAVGAAPPLPGGLHDFDRILQDWLPVTLMLNSLNRSLGQEDAYPFALGPGALHKLRFIHDLLDTVSQEAAAQEASGPPGLQPPTLAEDPGAGSSPLPV